jgi:hypothetical protein
MQLSDKRTEQYQALLRRLRQQVFDNPEIERRNLIQKVKNRIGITTFNPDDLSPKQLKAKEAWVNTMWM